MTPLDLKLWRVRKGLNQEKAAAYFGRTRVQYGKWERGEVEIPHWAIAMINNESATSS